MTAQYELTLQDLRNYVANHQDEPTYVVGRCKQTCKCLGVRALEEKYPENTFEIPVPSNHFFCVGWNTGRYPIHEEDVWGALCEFDCLSYSIKKHEDLNWEQRQITTMQELYEAAHDGKHPYLAQLFSSPSHPSLSQE